MKNDLSLIDEPPFSIVSQLTMSSCSDFNSDVEKVTRFFEKSKFFLS